MGVGVKYSIFFTRELKIYYGHFTVDSNSHVITEFIFNIYNINELTMNPEYEYKFDNNIMYMKRKQDSESEWDKQNMSSSVIENKPPIFTITSLHQSYNYSSYAIYNQVDEILIEARITVDNTNKRVTDFYWKYSNIDCLSMNHNQTTDFKYMNGCVYMQNKDENNQYEQTTWNRVFNINETQITDIVINKHEELVEKQKIETITDTVVEIPNTISLQPLPQPLPQPDPQTQVQPQPQQQVQPQAQPPTQNKPTLRPVQMKIQRKQKHLGPTEIIHVPKEPVFKMFDAGR